MRRKAVGELDKVLKAKKSDPFHPPTDFLQSHVLGSKSVAEREIGVLMSRQNYIYIYYIFPETITSPSCQEAKSHQLAQIRSTCYGNCFNGLGYLNMSHKIICLNKIQTWKTPPRLFSLFFPVFPPETLRRDHWLCHVGDSALPRWTDSPSFNQKGNLNCGTGYIYLHKIHKLMGKL